jgi:hypothetical protein
VLRPAAHVAVGQKDQEQTEPASECDPRITMIVTIIGRRGGKSHGKHKVQGNFEFRGMHPFHLRRTCRHNAKEGITMPKRGSNTVTIGKKVQSTVKRTECLHSG